MPIYSHPPSDYDNPLLKTHLTNVKQKATRSTPDTLTAPGGTPLPTLTEIAAILHDIGKAHPEFQDALTSNDTNTDIDHSPVGAAAAYSACRARDIPPIDATIASIAVAKHHQNLPDDPHKFCTNTIKKKHLSITNGTAVKTVYELQGNTPDCVKNAYEYATNNNETWHEFTEQVLNPETGLKQVIEDEIYDITTEHETLDYYTCLLTVWSSLTFADEIDAADITLPDATPPEEPPETSTLTEHVEDLNEDAPTDTDTRTGQLNTNRQDAYETVNDPETGTIYDFHDADTRVATLTLPTGLGKTLTGLTAAFTLRDLTTTDAGQVIYALPYTSIIDQTHDTITNDIYNHTPTGKKYTIHHHLSQTRTTTDNTRTTQQERHLGRTWQANTILTTFVQLFESIIGPKKTHSKKLPNIHGSTIILDEPQTLPLEDWDWIRDAIHILTTHYNCNVILMTATQPSLFATDTRITPYKLISQDKREQYAADANRVTYTLHKSLTNDPIPIPDAVNHLATTQNLTTPDTPGESALVICNTINSANEFTDTLTTHIKKHTDTTPLCLNTLYHTQLTTTDTTTNNTPTTDLNAGIPTPDELISKLKTTTTPNTPFIRLHLTSNHRPIDRQRLIDTAKQLTNHPDLPPLIFTCTQIVEAGVDISFPTVYRDHAGLDSIVQAAGRCNRNFEHQTGTTHVWQLRNTTQNQTPSKLIYSNTGNNLLAETINALTTATTIPNTNIPNTTISINAVNHYYTNLSKRDTGTSPLTNGNIKEANNYTLIDNADTQLTTYITRTPNEKEKLEKLRQHYRENNYTKVNQLEQRLADRRISIRTTPDTTTTVEEHVTPLITDTETPPAYTLNHTSPAYNPITGLTNN